jgi:hypothetical protein
VRTIAPGNPPNRAAFARYDMRKSFPPAARRME